MCQKHCLSRSDDAGGDDDLKAKWDLRVGHTSTREESRWVQMVLYCQVKPWWVSGSLKGEIGCKRLLTSVRDWLCGYFLSDRKDDILWIMESLTTTYHWPLHQLHIKNSFLNSILDEKLCMEQLPGFVAQGVRALSLQVAKVTLRSESLWEPSLGALDQDSRV